MNQPLYDAIVVGSGISGGWAAKEFTEKGFSTLMLERGPHIEHRTDYKNDFTNPWDLPHRGLVKEQLVATDYPTQSKCYAFSEYNRERFVNDRKHEYGQVKPFDWIRGYQTGGKSILWGRQSYRWSDLDLNANKEDGVGVDWPIRYADLQPWYDYVEEFAGISGSYEGIEHLPDSVFQPAMELNCVEKEIKRRLEKAFSGRKLIIGRAAHLTDPKPIHLELGRSKCMNRSQCHRGCSFGAYFSTQSATLPAARRTGNLELVNNSVVKEVIFDAEAGRATGVRVIDRVTHEERVYRAKVVFLCASTLGTTQIMLNSVSAAFPDGIGNRSGVLGKYLMDHTMQVGARGRFEGLEDKYYSGRRPSGIYIPRFRNVGDDRQKYLRGFGYQGGGSRPTWDSRYKGAGIGKSLKHELHNPGPWMFSLGGFGEMLPDSRNRVTLDKTRRDEWGIPIMNIDCQWRENEYRMREDMLASAIDMLKAAGLKDVEGLQNDHAPGLAIHEVGTARMGRDPRSSVLNGHNQCHDVANLFVTDGASLASSPCQNPSLTFMALTARAVDFAARELRAGRL